MKQATIIDKRAVRVNADTFRFERLFPGPIERVWEYLIDGEKRGKWLARGDAGTSVGEEFQMRFKHAELTSEPGEIPERFKQYENGHTSTHKVTVWEPPRRFGMSWGEGEEPSEVIFELTPEGKKVRFVLTHRRVSDATQAEGFTKGWHTHLEVLEGVLEEKPLEPFWDIYRNTEALYETAE